MTKMKTYSEMITYHSFLERFKYLKCNGKVGEETFGYDRYLNQILYRSKEWKNFRPYIIERDRGCDLGCEGHDIHGSRNILIHHINPITLKDIYNRNPMIFDPDNVVVVSRMTHNAIHYGDESLLEISFVERTPNDTCPWKL